MKTRIELWKEYRKEINKNISLQMIVNNSNKKLEILRKRLKTVYPEYEVTKQKNVFVSKIKNQSFNKGLNQDQQILDELNQISNKIKDFEEEKNDYNFIDNIDFHSHVIDSIKEKLYQKEHKEFEYIKDLNVTNILDIKIEKPKKIDIGRTEMMMKIAIDGPSGSGKSTIAKLIAKKKNLLYVNTGLVYRAIAFNFLKKDVDLTNEDEVTKNLSEIKIDLNADEKVNLNNEDVTKKLRSDVVSQFSSKVASLSNVRKFALSIQKKYANMERGVIMDGRDTTFKIMPNADVKIFLDTSAEIRAKRRLEQNRVLGFDTNYENVLKEIKERDIRDQTREQDPLQKIEDAHLIDASNLSIEDVVKQIESIILEVKKQKEG